MQLRRKQPRLVPRATTRHTPGLFPGFCEEVSLNLAFSLCLPPVVESTGFQKPVGVPARGWP